MSEGPWAYYTDVETQYEVDVDGKAAVWQDDFKSLVAGGAVRRSSDQGAP